MSNHQLSSFLKFLKGFKNVPAQKPGRPSNRSKKPTLGNLEHLEDRSVPASLYVDLPGAFVITKDTGPAGFSNGDTVTWNGSTSVNSLTVGKDAFGSVQSAVSAASANDKIYVASETYTDGSVKVLKDGLTIDVPAKTTGFSLQVGNTVSASTITVTGSGAVNVVGNQMNNKIVGNDGNNTLDATFNVEDFLKADPTSPVSIPTTASGTGVTAMSGRLVSTSQGNFFVFRVRNGTSSALTTTGVVFGGATFASNFTLPAMTDTFFAAPTNASWGGVTAVFSGGVSATKAANAGVTTPFSYAAGGDDTLTGGLGNDTLIGGEGSDTAVYSGKYSDYTITVSGTTATVTDNRVGYNEGTDTLMSMEKLQFSDKTVRLAPSSLNFSVGTAKSGVSTNLVFGSLLASLSSTSGYSSVSVTLTMDGKTTDGVFTATNPGTLTSFGVSDSNISLTGTPAAINAFLNSGNIQYKSYTDASRTVSFNFGDGLNINGYTNLKALQSAPVFSSANTTSITYGQPLSFTVVASNNPTYSVTTGSLPAGVKLDSSTGVMSGTPAAGDYKFTITATNGSQSATQDFTLSVKQVALTVSAVANSKTYGDSDPTLTYSVTTGALVGFDAFTGVLSRAIGESIGTYKISQGTLSAGSNYSVTFVGADFTVNTRALTVTAIAKSKTYGDSDPALTFSVTSGSLVGSDSLSGALVRSAGESVGTYKISQGTLSASSNYSVTFVGADFTVSTKALTVTASDLSKTYGDADPALTYTVTSGSLVGSDAFTGALSRAKGESAGNYAINQNTLSAGANYSIKFVGANLTINKTILNVTATGSNKAFDGTTKASVTLSDDHLGNDKVIVTAASANYSDSQVGFGKFITVSGLTIGGVDAGNYTLASNAITTSGNITGSGVINKVLTVVGTEKDDEIIIALNPKLTSQIYVIWTVGGKTTYTPYNLAGLTGVNVHGADGNDKITLNAEVPLTATFFGDNGNDILRGGNYNDFLYGGEGNDILYGSLGDDYLDGGNGSDTLYGQDGNDILVAGSGDTLPNTLDGGAGSDTLYGSNGNNTLTGGTDTSNDGADTIYGYDGNNKIAGGYGNDVIIVGNGNNNIDGGSGNDSIKVGNGNNTVNGSYGDDTITAGNGNNTLNGNDGNDTIVAGSGNNRMDGGGGNDNITGGDGNNIIWGGNGDDTVTVGNGDNLVIGGFGDDTIKAGDGNNILVGEMGNDTIVAGNGNNILTGGGGKDSITAGKGNNLITGSGTTYDEDEKGLRDIQTEWLRKDNTTAEKKANLASGVGQNKSTRLVAGKTVIDDLTADQIFAGSGDNWIWF